MLLLLVTGNVDDRLVVQLVHDATPDARSTLATFELPGWSLPTVQGVSEERTPGKPTLTAVGDSGRVLAFVLEDGTVRTLDGTSWFAGWADDPEPYDPD